jgi:predicted nucleic acid-binding protein
LGEFAFSLLKRIKALKDIVLYSELTIKELSKYLDDNTIKELFSILSVCGLLEKVGINDKQLNEAHSLSLKTEVHLNDCIHTIIARDNNAVLVTRDKHFDALKYLIEIKKPEELF